MKKIISIALALVMVLSLMPTAWANEPEQKPVARIDTATYTSLADAIAKVENNETITMLQDVTNAAGMSVDTGKTFTIDFDGYTYTVDKPGAGSAGTTTQGFQLLEGQTITMKNGTINCSEYNKTFTWNKDDTEKGIAMVIQNYANLTLDNMTIDGTNIAHNGNNVRYVVSNNCGNVTIKDSTITAAAGDFAFDVYGGFQSYGDVTVTVSGNSAITGQVELARKSNNPSNTNKNKLIIDGGTFQNDSEAIKITSGEVVINGGTIKGSDNGASHDGECVILVEGESSKLTLNGGTITATGSGADGMYGVYALSGGTVEAKAGTINSHFAAFGLNNTTAPANISISGGTYTAAANPENGDSVAWWAYFCAPVYAACTGNINISGGTFNGYYGLSDRYSNVAQNLTISGGTFNGTKSALFIDSQTGSGLTGTRTISVTGGAFSSNPTNYVAKGYAVSKSDDNFVVNADSAKAENKTDTAAVVATQDSATGAVTVTKVEAAPSTGNDVPNTIDVSSYDDTTKATKKVSVDKDAMANVVTTNAAKPVEFKMAANTSVKFNVEAVQAIATNMEAAAGNVILTVTPQATVTGNEETAKSTVANAKTQVVTLELKQDGGNDLFSTVAIGAKAEVTVPFTMPSNCNTVSVYYLKNDGTAEYVGTANTAGGTATFAVEHFSSYALVPTYVGGGSYTPTAAQTITTDLTAGSITRVTVDGKVVDSKNYTVSGSNVTLSDAYMKTLSNGKHTVAIENATKVAKATITVNNTTTATTAKPVTASKTGDAGIALYAGMAVASLLGTGVVITSRKRKVR